MLSERHLRWGWSALVLAALVGCGTEGKSQRSAPGAQGPSGTPAPIDAPQTCDEVVGHALGCYGAALSGEDESTLYGLAEECDEELLTTNAVRQAELRECLGCMAQAFVGCAQGSNQIHTQLLACETCGEWAYFVEDVLPERPIVLTCDDPELEICDGEDNNCDGAVDDGHVCPDATVDNTVPFADRVYVAGTTSPGSCHAGALQSVWPELDPNYISGGFECYGASYRFGPRDRVYYYSSSLGLLARAEVSWEELEASPCGNRVKGSFAVDDAGALYYQCEHATKLYRDGEALIDLDEDYGRMLGVLSDGRMLVTSRSKFVTNVALGWYARDVSVLDTEGRELFRLAPHAEFGNLELKLATFSIRGDVATVSYFRTLQGMREIVIFNLQGDKWKNLQGDKWKLVRRLALDEETYDRAVLAVSDGTVFAVEHGPDMSSAQLRAFFPDGSDALVWREGDGKVVEHGTMDLLVGP
ncbi:MAG TPA: putative metal-binding motif-containing protein [Polyangiaceae bacterium]|nr:putative metal-binding motif-containing protein [Polyangiaceae bacterium]